MQGIHCILLNFAFGKVDVMKLQPLSILSIYLLFTLAVAGANKKFTLVIDAGHGGHDAGAIGTYSKEKNINLNVALAFGRYVETKCPDVRVIYTRKTDVFVTLHDRANIANRNKADLFVSIHTNAVPKNNTTRGLETYTLGMHRAADNLDVAKRENSVILVEKDYKQRYEGFDPNSAESYIIFEFMQDRNMAKSVDLARSVQKRVCAAANRPNKGVKQAGFLVLRETSMPSCLIELGFITTPSEEALLNSDKGIDDMARGIYQAFADYRAKYDDTITVPFETRDKRRDKEQTPKTEQKEAPIDKESVSDESQTTTVRPDTVPARPAIGDTVSAEPVFKVQIIASARNLRPGSQQFKGETDVECYQEGNMYKYTRGSSTDYNEIYRLRKQLLGRFPEAFIIAFKDGQRTDVVQAIKEFKRNKAKKK